MDGTVTVSGLTIVALSVYSLSVVGYLFLAFSSFTRYNGPNFFWKKPTVPPQSQYDAPVAIHQRWPQVILRTACFNGIQTIRCGMQAGMYFGGTTMTIAFVALFFGAATVRDRLLFMMLGFMAIAATVCFVQHLRMSYHLNFLVMVSPQEAAPMAGGTVIQTPVVESEASSTLTPMWKTWKKTHRDSFSRAVVQHVTQDAGAEAALSPRKSRTETLRHLEAEVAFDHVRHARRLALVLHRSSFNFSLAMRLMFLMAPLTVAQYSDVAWIVTTVGVLVMCWYFDSQL